MAFKRRSLALALIAIGFACQWIPWARIDRAAFQYHYYTALPFVVLAPRLLRRRALARRVAADLAARPGRGGGRVLGPGAAVAASTGRCARFVGVESVNPGSQACPALIPEFVLTAQTAALALVVGVGLIVVVLRFLGFEAADGRDGRTRPAGGRCRSLVGPALGGRRRR